MTRRELTEILYQALGEPIGLGLVGCLPDPGTVRQRLYAARAAAEDPALGVLQIRASARPEFDLVITKGAPPSP
jgi:hypothetical protein